MAIIRHTVLNPLNQVKPVTSLKNRRKNAGWSQDNLERVLRRLTQSMQAIPPEQHQANSVAPVRDAGRFSGATTPSGDQDGTDLRRRPGDLRRIVTTATVRTDRLLNRQNHCPSNHSGLARPSRLLRNVNSWLPNGAAPISQSNRPARPQRRQSPVANGVAPAAGTDGLSDTRDCRRGE